jgi:hypothetical protein
MAHLPPDLEALGDALTHATTRAAALRRHRIDVSRRVAACVAAGLVVFAAAAPSRLGSAEVRIVQRFASVQTNAGARDYGCDRPQANGGYLPPSCEISTPLQPQAARE